MRWTIAGLAGLLAIGLTAGNAKADDERELICVSTQKAPEIDGIMEELWAKAPALITHDPIAAIDITIRAAYTQDEIFVLVQYPDTTENRAQKDMVWDPVKKNYKTGPSREDTLVFKWSLAPFPIDLTLHSDESYKADIWYWKAHRTDPVGFADDKIQVYSDSSAPDAAQLISTGGKAFYLTRNGDEGDSAYRPLVYDSPAGDTVTKYAHRPPTGSRSDIRAKGVWKDGIWTIEMGRRLKTGNPDDLQFDLSQRFQFGVSRFEIAGRPPEPDSAEPQFGSGEITEDIWLQFE